MEFYGSAFRSDYLYINRWELMKLFFGKTLKDLSECALIVTSRKRKVPKERRQK